MSLIFVYSQLSAAYISARRKSIVPNVYVTVTDLFNANNFIGNEIIIVAVSILSSFSVG